MIKIILKQRISEVIFEKSYKCDNEGGEETTNLCQEILVETLSDLNIQYT